MYCSASATLLMKSSCRMVVVTAWPSYRQRSAHGDALCNPFRLGPSEVATDHGGVADCTTDGRRSDDHTVDQDRHRPANVIRGRLPHALRTRLQEVHRDAEAIRLILGHPALGDVVVEIGR